MIENRTQNVQSRMPVKFPAQRKPLQDLTTNLSQSPALLQNKLQKLQSKGNGDTPQLKKVVVYEPTPRPKKHGIKDAKTKNKNAPIVEKRINGNRTLFESTRATSRQAPQVEPTQRRPNSAVAALDTLTQQFASMSIEKSKCDDGYAKGENASPENQSPLKQPLIDKTVANGYVKETLDAYLPHEKHAEADTDIAPKQSQSAVGYFDIAGSPNIATDCKLEQAVPCGLMIPLSISKKEEKAPILDAAAPVWKEFRNLMLRSHTADSVPAPSVPEDFQYERSVPSDAPSPRGRKIVGRRTSPVASIVSVKEHARQRSQSSSENLADLLDDRDEELHRYLKQREIRRNKAISAMLLEQNRKPNAPSSRSQTTSSMDQSASIPSSTSSVSKVCIPPYPYVGWQQYDPMAPCTCNKQLVPARGTISQWADARIRYEPKELLQLNYAKKQSSGYEDIDTAILRMQDFVITTILE